MKLSRKDCQRRHITTPEIVWRRLYELLLLRSRNLEVIAFCRKHHQRDNVYQLCIKERSSSYLKVVWNLDVSGMFNQSVFKWPLCKFEEINWGRHVYHCFQNSTDFTHSNSVVTKNLIISERLDVSFERFRFDCNDRAPVRQELTNGCSAMCESSLDFCWALSGKDCDN